MRLFLCYSELFFFYVVFVMGVALIFVEFYEVMDNFTADHFFIYTTSR